LPERVAVKAVADGQGDERRPEKSIEFEPRHSCGSYVDQEFAVEISTLLLAIPDNVPYETILLPYVSARLETQADSVTDGRSSGHLDPVHNKQTLIVAWSLDGEPKTHLYSNPS
jgi:hypothetical protein